jgi:amidase
MKTSWLVALVLYLSFSVFSRANSFFPVEETTIATVQAAYLRGEVTTRQVVAAYLARIQAYDKQGPYINSFISLNKKALEEADTLDARLKAEGKLSGPLHGVPVVIKDCIDAVGMPMTSGFQGWKNYYPPTDAPLVAKIKAAGGIILGKVSLSEFTSGGGDNINSVLSGFSRNPYNTAFATGGSSGGTGASVAANLALVGVGTDTGGSIRMPSAHNALAGIRPTVGLVSRTGIWPNNSVRDTAGPMTRTVTDMAILLDAMVGLDPKDAATQRAVGHIPATFTSVLKKDALKGARLGVLRQVFNPKITDPRIIANFEKTIAELKAAGAEIIDNFTVPEIDTLPRAPQTAARRKADVIKFFADHPGMPYNSPQAMADSRLAHPLHQAGLENVAAAGPAETDAATIKGLETEEAYRVAFTKAMNAQRIDAVIFPTWSQLPVVNGDRNTQVMTNEPKPNPAAAGGATGAGASAGIVTGLGSSLTFVGSTLQWPALSVPSGYLGQGLPVGLQILGRAWDDAKIIGYAYAYEQATHYRRPPPSVPPLGPASTTPTAQ